VLADAVPENTWWRMRYLHERPIASAMHESRAVLRAFALHLRNASIRPRQLRERIERLTNGAASPALTALAHRVNARLVAIGFPEPPPPYEGTLQYRIDFDERAVVVEDPTYLWRAQVSLLDHDESGASVSTNASPRHALMRELLERTIDAIFDPKDELHAKLRTALESPAWEQFLLRVRAATEASEAVEEENEDERLAWRITLRGAFPVLEPLVQKRSKRGWSPGATRKLDDLYELFDTAMLDEHDERVLYALGRPRHGEVQRSTMAALEALAGHPRVMLGPEPVQVRTTSPELMVLEDDDELFRVALRIGEEQLMAGEAVGSFIEGGLLRAREGELWIARTPAALRTILELAARYAVAIPRSAGDELVALLTRIPSEVGLELPPALAGRKLDANEKLLLRLEPLPAAGLFVKVLARPLGAGAPHPPGEGPIHLVGAIDGARVHTVRDFGAERHAADALVATLGLDRAVHEGAFGYRIDAADEALRVLELLRTHPELATIEWPDGAMPWSIEELSGTQFVVSTRGSDYWLDAKLDVDDQRVELANILRAIQSGRKYVQLGPQRLAKIADKLRADLDALAPVLHVDANGVRAAAEAISRIEDVLGMVGGDGEWKAMSERLRASRTLEPELPDLRAELRDYQIDGVKWLLRTASWARGVCLADEMGLGKTVQTIALLAARASLGPSMVVCPTSIGDNWRRECERFAPGLRTIVYRGAGRSELVEKLGPGDIVIASYDVVARDADVLAPIELSTLVLDEAQAIKNPGALRTVAVRKLKAGFRVALTGTPIENRLSELFSLFAILTPGLLGPWDSFRARFAVPIERDGDLERLAQLRELLRPFLLRRTKAQVARELPPRIEVVRTVELSEAERALYEAERREAIATIERRRGDPQKVRFVLLSRLTRMRRLVCDPSLVIEGSTVPSSKIEELLSLMGDLRREDHRALVFSQFTSLLARVGSALDARSVPYLYLDGATPPEKRTELVDRWQSGNDPFFLISLKAGGTGLNLTAADYVIHLDPWWNPAVEDQASDRAHRIGQTKPVTIVRLVAQGTIEERVLDLHESKRRLASGLLEGADTNAAIDTDALLELLDDGQQRARTTVRKVARRV
jgi:superfamily II DNA or RNA helicase